MGLTIGRNYLLIAHSGLRVAIRAGISTVVFDLIFIKVQISKKHIDLENSNVKEK